MTEKFTPGEWRANECRYGFTIETDEAVVVRSEDPEGRYGTIENGADVRLIAAAPDMYEALKQLVGEIEGLIEYSEGVTIWLRGMDAARAALKKAVPHE